MKRTITARYRPPDIPPAVVAGITVAFAFLTLARGLSWFLAPDPDDVGQVLADTAFGLRTWGALLGCGAVLLISCMALRRHFFVWCSHALLTSTYAGIGLSVLSATVHAGTGWQGIVSPIGGVIWHAYLARRMGPVARSARSTPPEAVHGQRADH